MIPNNQNRCQELTFYTASIGRNFLNLPSFQSENLQEIIRLNETIGFLIEKAEELIDKNQVKLREKIAKKLGADFVDGFSEGCAWAYFHKEKDVERILVDMHGRILDRVELPHIDVVSTKVKNGVALVRKKISQRENSIQLTILDVKKGDVSFRSVYEIDKIIAGDFEQSGTFVVEQKDARGKTNAWFGKAVDGEVERLFDDREDLNFGLFWKASAFSGGVAWVKINATTTKFIDLDGNILGQTEDAQGTMFFQEISDGVVWLQHSTNYEPASLYDTSGKYLFSLPMYHTPHPFHDGLANIHVIGDQNKASNYYIDKSGKKVGSSFYSTGEFSEGLAAVCREQTYDMDGGAEKKFFYIDSKGVRAFRGTWPEARKFHEGFAIVADRNGLSGLQYFINTEGKNIFDFKFDSAEPFSDGVALIFAEGREFRIDRKGREVFKR